MRDAIRNVRDLLINPYRAFMRIESKSAFDIGQYALYIMSILILEFGKEGIWSVLELLCIGASSFLMGWVYLGVINACGGKINYWRSLNAQVCMATLVNLGNLFELGRIARVGGAISFAIEVYCIYLHIRYVIVVGNGMIKRTIIVYITIFLLVSLIIYISFGLLAGVMISERGYIG